jgi:dTDP-4-dehydrorhamnose reductase
MVGRAVKEHCESVDDAVLALEHSSLDIADAVAVERIIQTDRPDLIINCAAWTNVDGCEMDHARAFAANATGPENLARACDKYRVRFVTISTDYVFDGRKDGFYTQDDDPNPESVYASSKLEGERRARAAYGNTIVARTGFVFGSGGRNFLSTIVERARAGQTIHAISDAYGTPTYARDLAARLRELGEKDQPDIYHVVNGGGGASFEEFAREAVFVAGCQGVRIVSVAMDSLKRPAPRPRNSRLHCLRSGRIGLSELRDWRVALREFVEQDNSHVRPEMGH